MKNFQDYVAMFNSKRKEILEMVEYSTIYVDCPDEQNCRLIEQVLRMLGENGNTYAAALYIAVTAYDNHKETFSEAKAMEFYYEEGVMHEYEDIIEELFEDVLDESVYVRFQYIGQYWLFEKLNQLSQESAETESSVCDSTTSG